ncbi:MAG: hypothetical protein GC159_01380 [Phycisphaera sp.]|nr:hypothetical protein [Phycisphaera sp.]
MRHLNRFSFTATLVAIALGAAAGCATSDGPATESYAHHDGAARPATAATTTQLRKPEGGVRGVMYQKLEHANGVLRGLATEDFPSIRAHAVELSKLTQQGQWATINNPDYQRYSEEFERAVQSLGADGETADVDGATLHYFQMTLACVNCHRYIRKIRQ